MITKTPESTTMKKRMIDLRESDPNQRMSTRTDKEIIIETSDSLFVETLTTTTMREILGMEEEVVVLEMEKIVGIAKETKTSL